MDCLLTAGRLHMSLAAVALPATLLLCACGATGLAANTSELWGTSGERWSPRSRLPDFSFAGYHMGEKAIPTVQVRTNVRDLGAKGDGTADDTQAFRDAIAKTDSGAVYIPEGRYRITNLLEITKSNVVLRGAGAQSTVLFLARPLKELIAEVPYYGGIIRVVGENRGSLLTTVVAPAKRGDTELQVASTEGLQAGRMVRLRMTNPPDNSLGRHLYADQGGLNEERRKWYAGRIVDWVVPVASVKGSAIVLQRPLRLDVRPEWNPEIWSHAPTVQEVGIEDLSIEFPNAQYAGHYKEEGHFAIYMQGVFNCWVRNVTIVDADIGVVMYGAGFNTVTNVTLQAHWRTGKETAGETGHYGFVATSHAQDNLFADSRLETTYVHNLSVNAFASGNVYSSITCPSGRFDHHGGAPYENLYTDIVLAEGARDLFRCGGNRADEPSAGARTTFWNVRCAEGGFPGAIPTLPDGNPKFPQINVIGLDAWAVRRTQDAEWIERWPGETTQPPNLYRAQLRRRLGPTAP